MESGKNYKFTDQHLMA